MEWLDLVTRVGGTAGFFVLMVYGFNQVRARDGEWKEIIEAKEAQIARLEVENELLRAENGRLRSL